MRRDVLFDVYLHPQTGRRVGFCQIEEGYLLAQEKSEKANGSIAEVTVMSGVKALAQKLKSGFVKIDRRWYFDQRSLSFTNQHPELQGSWILATSTLQPSRIVSAVQAVALTLPVDVVLPEEIQHWVSLRESSESYVSAGDDTCLWALVLAQVSMDNGWMLRGQATLGRLPDLPPSMAPAQWADWLSKSFSSTSIDDCLKALGWTTEAIIISSATESLDTGNLAAFF